ncbi:MAG: NAD(P)-binding protein [Polyangiaceae bacterium]|nr:NAD(P)-binding protein [Polyangiaceae bacterium]
MEKRLDSNHPKESPFVIVIGAGVAGLSASRVLSDAGCAVSVFDRGRFPGGRVASFSSPRPGVTLEKGATSFWARTTAFLEACRCWVKEGLLVEEAEGYFRFRTSSRDWMVALSAGLKLQSSSQLHELTSHPEGFRWEVKRQESATAHAAVTGHAHHRTRFVLALPPRQAVGVFESKMKYSIFGEAEDALKNYPYGVEWVFQVSWTEKSGNPGELRVGVTGELAQSWAKLDRSSAAEQLRQLFEQRPQGHELARYYADLPPQGCPCAIQAHRWGLAYPSALIGASHFQDPSKKFFFCGDYFGGEPPTASLQEWPSLLAQSRSLGAAEALSRGIERAWCSGVAAAKALLSDSL